MSLQKMVAKAVHPPKRAVSWSEWENGSKSNQLINWSNLKCSIHRYQATQRHRFRWTGLMSKCWTTVWRPQQADTDAMILHHMMTACTEQLLKYCIHNEKVDFNIEYLRPWKKPQSHLVRFLGYQKTTIFASQMMTGIQAIGLIIAQLPTNRYVLYNKV